MKKYFLSILFMVAVMFAANAQTTMTPSGNTDSSATKYITATVGGGFGQLTIQAVITKVANTGSTVAGYAILQGSDDGTNFVNVKTWKTLAKGSYGGTLPFNMFDVDTFTLTNTTSAQTYVWPVSSYAENCHPYLYYRVAIVMTTTTVTGTGNYIFRRRI